MNKSLFMFILATFLSSIGWKLLLLWKRTWEMVRRKDGLFLTSTLLKPLRGPAGTFTLTLEPCWLLLGEGDGSTKDHVWKTILGTMSSLSKLEIRAVMLSLESISVMFLSEKRIWKGSRSFSEVLMFPNCFVICEACLPVVVL